MTNDKNSSSWEKIRILENYFKYIFKDFIYLILERGKGGRKRWREISVCGYFLHTPYWGPGLQPSTGPNCELNQRPFGLQAGIQPTELHQPGLENYFCHFEFDMC